MAKRLFERVIEDHFFVNESGNIIVKREIGPYKRGECVNLIFDCLKGKIVIYGNDRCVISVHG